MALYVEADPPIDILRKDTIEFRYDLVPQQNLADDMEGEFKIHLKYSFLKKKTCSRVFF